jgi:hypothetical protein
MLNNLFHICGHFALLAAITLTAASIRAGYGVTLSDAGGNRVSSSVTFPTTDHLTTPATLSAAATLNNRTSSRTALQSSCLDPRNMDQLIVL